MNKYLFLFWISIELTILIHETIWGILFHNVKLPWATRYELLTALKKFQKQEISERLFF